jgi:hypothetical protein
MIDPRSATIAVFKWAEDVPSLLPPGDPRRISQDDGEEMTYRSAQPAAIAIHAALQQAGYVAADEVLSEGELGWHMVASNAGRTYWLFVHWTGIQYADFLAIQPSLRRGWLASLFRPPPPAEAMLPAKQMLSGVLDKLPTVTDLQWLTESQFAASYCRGEH